MKTINIYKKQSDSKQYNKELDVKQRIQLLKQLKNNILFYEQEIYDALKKDLNKSYKESFLCEISEVINEIEYHIKNIKK